MPSCGTAAGRPSKPNWPIQKIGSVSHPSRPAQPAHRRSATPTAMRAPEIAVASSDACSAVTSKVPVPPRQRRSGRAVRVSLVRCSRARPRSLPDLCAGSGSDRCGLMARVEPGAQVPPPPRDRPAPGAVEQGWSWLGCQVRPQHQIWRLPRQLDDAHLPGCGNHAPSFQACRRANAIRSGHVGHCQP